MAFNAAAIGIVRTGGSDANGGFFNPGNTSFATDGAATSATGTSPVFTSASYNFVAGDVGARVFIKSGTNWIPGWYTIASVAANAATLTASIGNATLYGAGQAAVGVSTAAGCATTASPTGATWSVDYSNQDAAAISYTDMVIGGTTTTYTSAGNPVGKNIIGNYINVTSGTGFTVQRVEVVSTSGTTATCDKSLGTTASTGGNGALGGALLTPGMAGGIVIGGNCVFIRSGTYGTMSSVTGTNVSGGIVSVTTNGNANAYGIWEGFGTIPRDMGTKPVLTRSGGSTISVFAMSGNFLGARNLTVDGATGTAITGIDMSSVRGFLDRCKAVNCSAYGIKGGNSSVSITRCEATACSGTAGIGSTAVANFFACESYANTTHGFSLATNSCAIKCISSANSGASSDGFVGSTMYGNHLVECVSYGNGRHGFNVDNSGQVQLTNCLAEANAGYGFTATAGVNAAAQLFNCGSYNNTSGAVNTTQLTQPAIGFVTNTTGTFFTNAASGDFSLNATTNQGALARSTGFPGLMPRGLSTGYADLGAIRHQDAGGSSGGSYCF